MILRIQVTENLEGLLKARAEEMGLPVETLVLQTRADYLASPNTVSKKGNSQQFNQWLRDWAEQFPTLNQPVDGSRESIYA